MASCELRLPSQKASLSLSGLDGGGAGRLSRKGKGALRVPGSPGHRDSAAQA